MVSGFLLIVGFGIIANNIYSGYTSFFLYFLPLIFIGVGLAGIFKEQFSNVTEKIFSRISDIIYINSYLLLFLTVGILLTIFLIKLKVTDFIGYLISLSFIIFPLVIFYGINYGFSVSDKTIKAQDKRRDLITFDNNGISIEMPLFDKTCIIDWQSIETIIYYNYVVHSDFTEYYQGYILHLNKVPLYQKHQRQWWLNKLFPKDSTSKLIDIKSDAKNFAEMPSMLQKYLNISTNLDFGNPLKGELISRQSFTNK